MVEPFLREKGYRLVRRADVSGLAGSRFNPALASLGDTSELLFTGTASKFIQPVGYVSRFRSGELDRSRHPLFLDQSPHTYPAFDVNGKLVFIKTVPAGGHEMDVWKTLGEASSRSNHTVPILDVLHFSPDFSARGLGSAPEDERYFVIMQSLNRLHPEEAWLPDYGLSDPYPSLQTVEDVAILVHQLIEVSADNLDLV